jgi:peroxiredoxin
MDAAEQAWLDRWSAGPTEPEGHGLAAGATAPDLTLPDHTGAPRRLSEFWAGGPALLMFWRHFGCSCGAERARRLRDEWDGYREAGLTPVVIGLGEPARAAAYRARHDLPCPVLCDPGLVAYHAYGVGQWPVERVLYDAPESFWSHPRELGEQFQASRRDEGRAPVDDPWRATAEFVVRQDGTVQLPYLYQYCDDHPDARVLTTAARLSIVHAMTP